MLTETIVLGSTGNRTLQAASTVWATAYGAASGSILTNYDTPYYAIFAGSYLSGGDHYIYRAPLYFDTTGLDSTAAVESATLSLYVFTISGTGKNIYVVEGVQQDTVIASDYGALRASATSGGALYLNDIVDDQYNVITLNATGLGWINCGGITKLCIRGEVDMDNENPVSTYDSFIYFYSAQKGTGYQPKLTINSYKVVYPTSTANALPRVTGIRHIYKPGVFRMVLNLGDVSNTIEIAEHKVRKELEAPEQQTPDIKPPAEEPKKPSKLLEAPWTPPAIEEPIVSEKITSQIQPPPDYLETLQKQRETQFEAPKPFPSVGELVKTVWRAMTPWEEEKGETFGSAFTSMIRRWFGG